MFFSTTYEMTKDQMALGGVELYSCQNNYFYFFFMKIEPSLRSGFLIILKCSKSEKKVTISLSTQLRMGPHQATPEHFIRCINDTPADESSGVIDVDTIKHLAQRAFPLFVNYLARPP